MKTIKYASYILALFFILNSTRAVNTELALICIFTGFVIGLVGKYATQLK